MTWALALVLSAAAVPTALAASVRLDPGFGDHGVARTPLPPSFVVEPFEEIAATAGGGVATLSGSYGAVEMRHYGPDGALTGTDTQKEFERLHPPEAATADGGRLVAVAGSEEGTNAVTRYSPGTPDTSFGDGGTSAVLPFSIEALAVLPSGKVLAAGSGVYSLGGTKSQPENQVFVARLGADGKLDPGFGEGGVVKLRSEYKVANMSALEIQGRAGEGAEVVSGATEPIGSVLVALGPDGKLDPAFGEGGQVKVPGEVVGAGAAGEAVLIAGDKPTGSSPPPGEEPEPRELYVARYDIAGKLDPTYAGGSGIAVVDPAARSFAGSALVGADGSVTIGAFAVSHPPGCPLGYFCDTAPIVARVTPDGRPDPGFGENGVVRLTALGAHFGAGYRTGVEDLTARPGGGVFAAGATERAAFVAALGADGSLDGGFGEGGIVTDGGTLNPYSAPVATAADAGGDIFVVAQTDTGPNMFGANAVLRYSAGGRLDGKFGEGGAAFVPAGVRGLAVAPDGSSFVISGESSPSSSLTGLTPAGAVDPNFGSGGSAIFPFPKYRFLPVAIERLTDGDLLVAGNRGSRPAVLRYLPDGKIDRTFGKGGVEVVKLGQNRLWRVKTMAVDGQGRIVLGGSTNRRHQHGCCTEAGALIRLRADGRLDPSFGHGGGVILGSRSLAAIEGLAVRGNRILAAATFTKFAGLEPTAAGNILYAVRPGGRLDRSFGRGGSVKAYLSPHRKSYTHSGEESVSVFSTPRHVFLVRHGFYAPLLSFSPNGDPQRNVPRRLKHLLPHRLKENVPLGPVATLDGPSLLLLAFGATPLKPEGHGARAEVNLQRLLLR